MAKNLQARRVPVNQAYEIWLSNDGWIYHVLKKYQVDDRKPFGRWLCCVVSPMTSERGDVGDTYVETVKNGNRRVVSNPHAYTIMFHVHAERPGQGNIVNIIDTWPTSLKKALELYDKHCSEYSYCEFVAELYETPDCKDGPVEIQAIFSFGMPLAMSDTDVRSSRQGENHATNSKAS